MRTVLFDGEWGKVIEDCGCEATTQIFIAWAEHGLENKDIDPEAYLARHKMFLQAAKESSERHGKSWLLRAVIETHDDSRRCPE